MQQQRLWGLRSPQRTSSKQVSIGTPGSNVLDTGLLHQLRVVCALRPSVLLSLTENGALKDLHIQVLHCCIERIRGAYAMLVLLMRVLGNACLCCASMKPRLMICSQGILCCVAENSAHLLTLPIPDCACSSLPMWLLLQGVNMVAAETIMRRLLPGLPPLRFQHLMRVICHEILHHIQDDHPTRQAHNHGSASLHDTAATAVMHL